MALKHVRRRWWVVGAIGLLIVCSAVLGVVRQRASDPVTSNLPFKVDPISNSYVQVGNQISQYQVWRLREASDALAEFKRRCTKEDGWSWIDLGKHTWQATRMGSPAGFDMVTLTQTGDQVMLHRGRSSNRAAYAMDWCLSGGHVKLDRVEATVVGSGWTRR